MKSWCNFKLEKSSLKVISDSQLVTITQLFRASRGSRRTKTWPIKAEIDFDKTSPNISVFTHNDEQQTKQEAYTLIERNILDNGKEDKITTPEINQNKQSLFEGHGDLFLKNIKEISRPLMRLEDYCIPNDPNTKKIIENTLKEYSKKFIKSISDKNKHIGEDRQQITQAKFVLSNDSPINKNKIKQQSELSKQKQICKNLLSEANLWWNKLEDISRIQNLEGLTKEKLEFWKIQINQCSDIKHKTSYPIEELQKLVESMKEYDPKMEFSL